MAYGFITVLNTLEIHKKVRVRRIDLSSWITEHIYLRVPCCNIKPNFKVCVKHLKQNITTGDIIMMTKVQ